MKNNDSMHGGDDRLSLTVANECTLQGGSAELIKMVATQLTLDNPQYVNAKKYNRWVGKRLKPHLHFYSKAGDSLTFPRGFAGQAVKLCRSIMPEAPLEINDRRRILPPMALDFRGELRTDQKEALDGLLQKDFGVLEAATGAGKTIIALALMARRGQPTLILVHTKELMYQWAEKIDTFLGFKAGLIGDGRCEAKPLTVAIVNSARKGLDTLPPLFGQICVDECHRVPASLFTDVVTAFDCKFMLGLSATAFRSDGLTKLIYYFLGDRQFQIDQRRLEDVGAILRPRYILRETTFRFHYRDNYQDLMKALTADEKRNRMIVRDIVREAEKKGGAILVVSDRVEHCEALAALLLKEGIIAQVLTGRMTADERSKAVEAIRRGVVQAVVATIQLIGEGFDCPGLHTLFLTTPIKFTGRLLQVVGRILRPSEGKKPRVYDYIDNIGVLKSSARMRRKIYENP